MTARSSDGPILEALAQLEIKLTALITAGLSQIKDDHSRALLEQAKLNATFASRDVVETLRRQVDANSQQLVDLTTRVAGGETRDAQLSDHQSGTLISITGWAVGGGLSLLAILVSFALNHLVH